MNISRSLFLAFTFIFSCSVVNAQTAEEVMAKHQAAIGGDAWKKVSSLKITSHMLAAGDEVEVIETTVKDKGVRSEIIYKGQSGGYEIVTPAGGWRLDLMVPDAKPGVTKPIAIPAEELKVLQDQLDPSDDYINYKAKGFTAEFIGKESLNGTACYKLKITGKSGIPKTVYFDAATFYKVTDIERVETPQGAMDIITTFSEFKKFPEGIVLAMHAKNDYQDISITGVEINRPVDDKLFEP